MKNNKLFQRLAIFLALSTPSFAWAEPLISAGEQAARIIESDREHSLIKAQENQRMAIVRMFRTAMSNLREDAVINSTWKLMASMNLEEGVLLGDSQGLKCGGSPGTLKIDAAGKNAVAVELNNVMCATARLAGKFGPVEIHFMNSEKNNAEQDSYTTYECRLPDADTLLCKTAEVVKNKSAMWVNDVGYLIFTRTP